jgi:hypothetical protein
MVSRVGSAVLALVATILLACSIFLAPWWSGHPTVDGNQLRVREVSITLLSSQFCDHVGEADEKCTALPLIGSFTAQEFIEIGAVGIVALAALGLAIMALQQAKARRAFAKIVMAGAGASLIVAIALVIQGPELEGAAGHKVSMPLGPGMVLFGIGAISSIIAGIFALQPAARPRPTPAPGQWVPPHQQQPHAQQEVDVLALLQDDAAVRPAQLGLDPRQRPSQPPPMAPSPYPLGAPVGPYATPFGQQPPGAIPSPVPPTHRAPAVSTPSPGGPLPGPQGPLAPPFGQPEPPMFQGAPQLRPLYDAAPNQGGTGGYVPTPGPPLPTRPPTPMPRAAVGAIAGIPTPPPFGAQDSGARPKTLPPPLRGKPSSMPPPIGQTIHGRPGAPTSPPPPPPARATQIAGAAVPPPALPTGPTGPKTTRAPTDPIESLQTVQHDKHEKEDTFDAAATAARPPRSDSTDAGDNTDVGVVPVDENAVAAFEVPTSENRAFGEAPTATDAGRADTDIHSLPDNVATKGRPKVGIDDKDVRDIMIEKPTVPAKPGASPRATGPNPKMPMPAMPVMPMPAPRTTPPPPRKTPPSTQPATQPAARSVGEAPTIPANLPRPGTPVTVPAASPAAAPAVPAKVPITTAPATLPPPTAKQTQSQGPSPACPQCEAPMAWVEEHLRFYCKSCKMYF